MANPQNVVTQDVLRGTAGFVTQDLTPGTASDIEHGIKRPAYHPDLDGRELDDQHPISAITGLQDALDTKVDKTTEPDKVYGTDSEGNQTLYGKDSFGKVDDVRAGGVSVVNNKIAYLGTMAKEAAANYTKTSDLAQVALDGQYSSLLNKPTIGDATLTFKTNGTTAGTFSANQTEDATIDISTTSVIIRRL